MSDAHNEMSEELNEHVAMAALDWLGAMAAGWIEPAAANYRTCRELIDPGGGSTADHAFMLGALSHLAEVDDGHRDAMMHPGIVTFSPLFAIASRQAISLRTFRRAVVAGYETGVRVGAALGPAHYRRFHTSATAGSFGAAAASAVALGLNARQCLHALGHAGSQAMGLWQFLDDGAEAAKAANPAFAARNGVSAAFLAKAGIHAATRILEGTRGLAWALGDEIDAAPLQADFLPKTSALASRTVKAWPVCGQMHHVLDAMRSRLQAAPVHPAQIDAIVVESFEALKRIADVRQPTTPAQARFSTAWCLAYLLIHDGPKFDTLRNPAVLRDQLVAALEERITIRSTTDYNEGYPSHRRCRINVSLRDGNHMTWEHSGRRGDPELPFSRPQMLQRFEDIAACASQQWRSAAVQLLKFLLDGSGDETLSPQTMEPLLNDA